MANSQGATNFYSIRCTLRNRMIHTCVGNLSRHCLKSWLGVRAASSHYTNQSWSFVIGSLRTNLRTVKFEANTFLKRKFVWKCVQNYVILSELQFFTDSIREKCIIIMCVWGVGVWRGWGGCVEGVGWGWGWGGTYLLRSGRSWAAVTPVKYERDVGDLMPDYSKSEICVSDPTTGFRPWKRKPIG